MAEKGIIFSAPMVRALLDGRKSQTRRLLTPVPVLSASGRQFSYYKPGGDIRFTADVGDFARMAAQFAPYAPGDRLYVRENWQALSYGDYQPTKSRISEVRYAATDPLADADKDVRGYPWRPCIHMPRWASRITLTVTEVRVQRLQEISEADAIAEGGFLGRCSCPAMQAQPRTNIERIFRQTGCIHHGSEFSHLWNTLHTAPGERWEDDPWVVAVSFDCRHGNIDAVPVKEWLERKRDGRG